MTELLEETAARFVVARETPGWSQADDAALEAWLEQSARHKAVFWRLEHGWAQADRIGSLGGGAVPVRYAHARCMAIKAAIALAASILPVLGGWSLLRPDRETLPIAVYSTGIGDRKIVTLGDGSTIDLNTDTSIRVAYSDSERLIFLDRGEAFFDVAHETRRSFVVQSGDREITDLGTQFLMSRTGDKLTTAVAQGKVRVARIEAGQPRESQLLSAGDRAVSEGRTTLTVANDMAYVASALSWRDGVLQLDGMTLNAAAEQFNRYSHRKLVIEEAGLGSVKIGGSFDLRNVDGFARLLGDAYGLKVEESATQIKISRD